MGGGETIDKSVSIETFKRRSPQRHSKSSACCFISILYHLRGIILSALRRNTRRVFWNAHDRRRTRKNHDVPNRFFFLLLSPFSILLRPASFFKVTPYNLMPLSARKNPPPSLPETVKIRFGWPNNTMMMPQLVSHLLLFCCSSLLHSRHVVVVFLSFFKFIIIDALFLLSPPWWQTRIIFCSRLIF